MAASFLAIVIAAVSATIRKGVEFEVTDRHRRMARSIINSTFESPAYSSSNYNTLAGAVQAVVIDPRGAGTGDDLNGTLRAVVTPGSVNGINATAIDYKQVTLTVTWPEPEGQQSMTIDRWVTP